MISDSLIRAQLPYALSETNLPELGQLYRGKVRDNYGREDRIVMITTDRVSAFDRVLGTIPFKGEVLQRLTVFWFEKVKSIAKTHLLAAPDPNAMVVRRAEPLPVEIVVRGYITGSLWRDYASGNARAYGISWPPGLRKDERMSEPVITPSTKASPGQHDEPLSEGEILGRRLVSPEVWRVAHFLALRLFDLGTEWAKSRGLILVDTKYEMGISGGELIVIDEIHTPDSSRYWLDEGYEDRFERGVDQEMLDKENIRQWLLRERGFSGEGEPPALPDDVRIQLARKYMEVFERLTGQCFLSEVGGVEARLRTNLAGSGHL